jgi:RND family efflux transporter MFP subunit
MDPSDRNATEELPELDEKGRTSPRSRITLFFGAGALIALAAVAGLLPKAGSHAALERSTHQATVPTVYVLETKAIDPEAEIQLPATIDAFQHTALYARTDGYLTRNLVDIGDEVEAGQLLAQIEAPEVDQELNRAVANLEQAKANVHIAETTVQRYQELFKSRTVSAQERDERQANFQARLADRQAAEAEVERLGQMKSFQRIVAPFSGKVTARNLDSGALVTSDGATASMLFQVAQVDPLRVFVSVPQTYLRSIQQNQDAEITVPEFPERIFRGRVTRTSGAIDPVSRTLRVEIQVPNPERLLLPGTYGMATLHVRSELPPILLPTNALIVRADGPQVAVVDKDSKVRVVKVQIGRDLGRSVEIVRGLEPGQRVISNPPDGVANGVLVNPIVDAPGKKT